MDDMTQETPAEISRSGPAGPMPDDTSHRPAALDTLRQAMRRARSDNAERGAVAADFRHASIVRLEMLSEALRPLIAQIPADVDLFDIGLMPGANPRLFIDMIGFVEMGRDARLYRFLQDNRHGRTVLAESTRIDTMVDAVTDYVARRLLERDKALAADAPVGQPEPRAKAPRASAVEARSMDPVGKADATGGVPPAASRRPALIGFASAAFAFLIDLLGSIAFFTILAAIGWMLWNRLHGQAG